MKIAVNGFNLNVEEYFKINTNYDYIFYLHGFTGSAKDWENIIPKLSRSFNHLAVDLIGHGQSDSPEDSSAYRSEAVAEQMLKLINHYTRKKVMLVGYSMGGRAALAFAVKYPVLLKGLVLESSTAGIKEEHSRTRRITQDEELAAYIESHTIEQFVDHWMNIEIFKTQKKIPERLLAVREAKIKNNVRGLSKNLINFSTGRMPQLYDQLKEIKAKTLLISGEYDKKYQSINTEMQKLIPYANHQIIKDAGHNTHFEQPQRFIEEINDFLDSF